MPVFKVNPKYAKLTEVTNGLFVCGVTDLNPEYLQNLGITCVINCTNEVPNLAGNFDFERLKLWLDDLESENIFQYFDEISDKIWENRTNGGSGKTLLHCLAGVSRSCSLALAYLVKYERLSLRRSYAHLALKRPLVRPNLGFWRQLIEYEKLIRKSSTVKIVELSEDENGPAMLIPDVYMEEMRRSCDLDFSIKNQKSESQAFHRRKIQDNAEKSPEKIEDDENVGRKYSLQVLEKCRHKIDNQSDLKLKELGKRQEIFGYINQNNNINLSVLDKRRKFSNCRKFTPSLESLPELHEREI